MMIDGSADADRRLNSMLLWDVNNGLARRSWARNQGAMDAIRREMARTPGMVITLPYIADENSIKAALKQIES
jgi:urocanate hydratase